MRRLVNHQSVRSRRSGFTIVELLMVVGILLFLIATSAFVVRNIGNKAREKATLATIVKINGMLNQRIQAFQRYLDSSRSTKDLQQQVNLNYALFSDPMKATYLGKKATVISRPVMEILARKDLFRQNFPQYIGDSSDVTAKMNALPGVSGAAGSELTSDGGLSISSEYLYYVLTQYDAFGAAAAGEDAFNASEVADTDGDGLKEFVDGWGRPLRFYRWPTRLFKPNGSSDHSGIDRTTASIFFSGLPAQPALNEIDPLNIDPDDPLGRIQHEDDRLGGLFLLLFDSSTSYASYKYGTMNTFWMPLVVSAGEDGILGLYEPFNTASNGVLAYPILPTVEGVFDNITNHNQRAGGR